MSGCVTVGTTNHSCSRLILSLTQPLPYSWHALCFLPIISSLDQGDLCRVLRRTMEVLRSLCLSSSLTSGLRDKARKAMDSLDRAPITDDSYLTLQQSAAGAEEASEDTNEEETSSEDEEDEGEHGHEVGEK